MVELSRSGFYCSQILVQMGLDAKGKQNPDLMRAVGGLAGGLGFSGGTCGALAGGACLIGLYAGKGESEEMEDGMQKEMIGELVKWFESEVGSAYGGSACSDILEGNPANRLARCPPIVMKTLEKVKAILASKGYDFYPSEEA